VTDPGPAADEWPCASTPADVRPGSHPGRGLSGPSARQAGYLVLAATGAGLCIAGTVVAATTGLLLLLFGTAGAVLRHGGRPADELLVPALRYVRRRRRGRP
jgi:hypothetical protein